MTACSHSLAMFGASCPSCGETATHIDALPPLAPFTCTHGDIADTGRCRWCGSIVSDSARETAAATLPPQGARRAGFDTAPVGPIARMTDPATAHDAAGKATSASARDRILVLQTHADAGTGGLTGEELAVKAGRPYESIGPRRKSLVDSLLLEPAGTRPNARGNPMRVYRCTELGQRTAAELRRQGAA